MDKSYFIALAACEILNALGCSYINQNTELLFET